MPRLAIVGDIHGAIDSMYKYLHAWQNRTELKLDGVVQVGDFGVYLPQSDSFVHPQEFKRYWNGKSVPIPTWVCPGNHEDYAALKRWGQEPNRIPNLTLLSDGEITNVLGVTVGAIWGNFSFRSWNNRQRIETARTNHPASPKAMHIYKPSVERLKQSGKFDVLITHDAPAKLMKAMKQPDDSLKAALGLEPDERTQGCPGFNELYVTGEPKYHFFGHFHTYYLCQQDNPTVVCLHCYNYNPAQSLWVIEL